MPAGIVRDREVAADELVFVVVKVVLDGNRVERLVRERRAEVGVEAHLVVQAVDVEDLVLDVGIELIGRHLGVHAGRAPEAGHPPGALLVERPPPSWSLQPTIWPCKYGTTRTTS